MTDTTEPTAFRDHPSQESPPAPAKPELKAAPPQLTRRDNPMEVRHASTSLNALTARVQSTLGSVWLLNDNLPKAVEDLAEVAERALALRRLLITVTTPPPAKET